MRATGFCLSHCIFVALCNFKSFTGDKNQWIRIKRITNIFLITILNQTKKKTVYYRSVITNTCMRWRYKILLHTIFIVVECAEKAPKPDWINIYRKMKHSFRSQMQRRFFFFFFHSTSLFPIGCVYFVFLCRMFTICI